MRLDGQEKGINSGTNREGVSVDSYLRGIAFHGTSEEGLIGKESSHGCVRMLNQDIIELFDSMPEKTLVEFQYGRESIIIKPKIRDAVKSKNNIIEELSNKP